MVPEIHLHATHERALDVVGYDGLKKHAAESEAGSSSSIAKEVSIV